MKILIMGGTRYFGRRLVHKLLETNHEVTVLSRGNVQDDFGPRVERLKAHRGDEVAMGAALAGRSFDVVVDQVCMTAKDAELSVKLFLGKISYYLMTSTMSVYDWGANLPESAFEAKAYQPRKATNPAEAYAEGKRAAEHVFAIQAAFPVSFARFPVVVGEDDYTERLLGQVRAIKNGDEIYYPNVEAEFSFITSEDAARALLWLLENRKTGPYNFAAADAFALKDLIQKIENITGKSAKLLTQENTSKWSPFGIPSSWYMNVDKAAREGFAASLHERWLVPLLQSYFLRL
ncbi:NAD-dependent epimerase/dehydratase family protein [Bdellovibrio sp.]|uniref:NAD-dependent epimerase/dehydratase family protein n=1 Tax=Bdellovibrio sp. TaxID=28201 RepID=UPI0032216E0F